MKKPHERTPRNGTAKAACCFLGFVALCPTSCSHHRTLPANLINTEASLPAGLPYNPLTLRVITSGADRQQSTMFTLFGNDRAVDHARGFTQVPYPPGSMLSLVTWRQQDDPNWFGAKIPGAVETIEFLCVPSASGRSLPYSYKKFAGTPLSEMPAANDIAFRKRADWILTLKASLMP